MITQIWQNKLYTGDNLYFLHGLNSESVDLIYLDPPFNSKTIYEAPIGSQAEGTSFKDIWFWSDVDEFCLERLAESYPEMVEFIKSIGLIHSKAMMAYITYMAQRVIELHRVLKETGSIYLHCDTTASHYLKLILDEIFGRDNFRNEIIWKRKTSTSGSLKTISSSHDVILSYAKNQKNVFHDTIYTPYNTDYIEKQYCHTDENGRYRIHDLVANPALGGMSPRYEFKGFTPKTRWLMVKEKLEELDKNNMIVWSKNGIPRRKIYLDETKGNQMTDIWDDINIASGNERTGYRTQKPLELLNRIIKISCPEDGLVLDPFCGCATTCVAAQQLGRKWIGIDIEPNAPRILIERLEKDAGIFKNFVNINIIPKRTDIKEEPISESIKERLFKKQEELCNGCKLKFNIQNFEIDHIVPKAKGGGDFYENYQLLCSSCNRIKGARPMEYLRIKIEAREKLFKRVSFGE